MAIIVAKQYCCLLGIPSLSSKKTSAWERLEKKIAPCNIHDSVRLFLDNLAMKLFKPQLGPLSLTSSLRGSLKFVSSLVKLSNLSFNNTTRRTPLQRFGFNTHDSSNKIRSRILLNPIQYVASHRKHYDEPANKPTNGSARYSPVHEYAPPCSFPFLLCTHIFCSLALRPPCEPHC
jgi:hypothetical protein